MKQYSGRKLRKWTDLFPPYKYIFLTDDIIFKFYL